MRRIASEKNAAASPLVRDSRMERIDRSPLDFEHVVACVPTDQRMNAVIAFQRLLGFAGQLHELPAHAITHRRQFDAWAARVAGGR